MYRKLVPVLLVVTMILVAGCSGGGSAPTPTATDAGSASGGSGGQTASSGNGGTGSGGGSGGESAAGFQMMNFTQPGVFTYDVYEESQGSGTMVWDVQSVDADQMTVHFTYEMGDTSVDTTVSGDHDTVQQQLMMTPASQILLVTMLSPMMAQYQDRKIAVGDSWTYGGPDGTMSYAVTGTKTFGGVECYNTEIRVNGSVMTENCIAPDRGLPPHVAYYNKDGSRSIEMTLKRYEAK